MIFISDCEFDFILTGAGSKGSIIADLTRISALFMQVFLNGLLYK